MSSKIPKSLEEQSAFAIALQSYQKICTSFIDIFDIEAIKNSDDAPSEKQLKSFKDIVENIIEELAAIPWRKGRIGIYIENAIEIITDQVSTYPINTKAYIPAMIFKLKTLKSACTDKDFDCDSSTCSIPSRLLSLVEIVLSQFENNDLKNLVIYKGMYPTIAQEILYSSRNITHLTISFDNITNEIVTTIGTSCPSLTALHFLHPFIWNSVSIDALFSCFFNSYSREVIENSFEKNQPKLNALSFPHLKHVTVAFDVSNNLVSFHTCLHFYYRNLESLWQDWYALYFEEDDFSYTEIILSTLVDLNMTTKLRSLVITFSILTGLLPFQFLKLLQAVPLLKLIYIECSLDDINFDAETLEKMHRNLTLLWKKSTINHIYLKNIDDVVFFDILNTIPKENCNNIHLITIGENTFSFKQNHIQYISSKFPNLSQITFISEAFRIHIDDEFQGTEGINFDNLKELHIHDKCYSNGQNPVQLRRMIVLLVAASPRLQVLSISLTEKLLTELQHITGPMQTVHMNFTNCPAHPKDLVSNVIKFVERTKHLHSLYLEEIEVSSFWSINKHFRNSKLLVKWCGLSGLPRN